MYRMTENELSTSRLSKVIVSHTNIHDPKHYDDASPVVITNQ